MKTLTILALTGIIFLGILLNSCQHEPELPPGTPTVYFNADIMLILNANCNKSGCHGSGEAPALKTHSAVYNYVTPLKPMQSKLYKVITAHSNLRNLMPPKPAQALPRHEIDLISIWILQGAPDN
jgi:hypothetical protein